MKLIPGGNYHQTAGPVAAVHQGLNFTQIYDKRSKKKDYYTTHFLYLQNGLAFWNCCRKCWCRTPGRTRGAACPEVVMLIIRRMKPVFSTKNPILISRIIQNKRTREKKVKKLEQKSDNIEIQCLDYKVRVNRNSLKHVYFN